MNRNGRILRLALKTSGILHLRVRRKLSFDSMENTEPPLVLEERALTTEKRSYEIETCPTETEDHPLENEKCSLETEEHHPLEIEERPTETKERRPLEIEECCTESKEHHPLEIKERPTETKERRPIEIEECPTETKDRPVKTAECSNEAEQLPVETEETPLETFNQQPLPGDMFPYSLDDEAPTYTELQTCIPLSTSNEADVTMFVSPHAAFSTVNAESQSNHSFNNICQNPVSSKQDESVQWNRRKRRTKLNKQYLDYLSDDDALLVSAFGECDTDSDVWLEGSSSGNSDEENVSIKKTQKKTKNTQNTEEQVVVGEVGIKHKKKNKRLERKEVKNSGREYRKSSGGVVNAKLMQPNPCQGKKCGNDCGSIPEERRQLIFDHYWKLTPVRRKDWLVSMSQRNDIKRKRNTESNKRNTTYKYFINEGEGKKSVCLQFLASTIAVSHKVIYYTVSNAVFGCAKEDLRGKCEPSNKTKEATKALATNFIKSLPAVPSHYCRKDSSRIYLPQEYKNLSNLYQVYRNRYIEQGIDIVSERVFRNIFTENFNIAFHVPKKDKCLKCLKFEKSAAGNAALEAEKLEHEAEKKNTYARFKAHQNIHQTDPSTLCVSFDLEKVLNTPHGQSMLLYYSRKLAVYNLCFYESATRNVYCFYWDETNGKRGANEIATIIHNYIQIIDKRSTVKHLLLYCDCCPGQNRNRTVLAMIHSTLQSCKSLETIQINFLLTGHTYMPVDSVHAVIERNIKNTIIYAPSQWYTVFSTARQNPMPYNVEVKTYKDFMKWDGISEKYFKGNLTGKISKVRVASFKKKDVSKVSLKNTMNESEDSVSVEVQCKNKIVPAVCYKHLLPISKVKYDNLNKLCKDNVIPAVFHNEYSSIPNTASAIDTLPESDMEDAEDV